MNFFNTVDWEKQTGITIVGCRTIADIAIFKIMDSHLSLVQEELTWSPLWGGRPRDPLLGVLAPFARNGYILVFFPLYESCPTDILTHPTGIRSPNGFAPASRWHWVRLLYVSAAPAFPFCFLSGSLFFSTSIPASHSST